MDWMFNYAVGPGGFTPGLALRDIFCRKRKLTKEFETIIYVSLSSTQVLAPPQDLVTLAAV